MKTRYWKLERDQEAIEVAEDPRQKALVLHREKFPRNQGTVEVIFHPVTFGERECFSAELSNAPESFSSQFTTFEDALNFAEGMVDGLCFATHKHTNKKRAGIKVFNYRQLDDQRQIEDRNNTSAS